MLFSSSGQFFGHFLDFFRTFCRHSGFLGCPTNDLPVANPGGLSLRHLGKCLTCVQVSFSSFLVPFAGHPSPPLFSAPLRPSPSKMLCSVERRALHRAWTGAASGWTSPQSSEGNFLPNLREKRSEFSQDLQAKHLSVESPAQIMSKNSGVSAKIGYNWQKSVKIG